MIKLEETFVSGEGGYSAAPLTYKQILRKDRFAVYQRFYKDGRPKDWEVIIIRIIPKGTTIFKAPPTEDDEERYAATSSWGKQGWGFVSLDRAMKKYSELCNESALPDNASDSVNEDEHELSTISHDMDDEPAAADIVPSEGEFTVNEYAEKHKMEYVNAYLLIKTSIANGSIVLVRSERRHARGRATNIYRKTKS
jgi:hypothetical protein